LDGSGKSTIVNELGKYLEGKGKKVFNLKQYMMEKSALPSSEEIKEQLKQYDVILSAEPTYSWIGQAIRQEIITSTREKEENPDRRYSALETADAFSLDRLVLYRRVILPLLKQGKTIIQDRGLTTSIVYQQLQAEPLSLDQILSFPGNKLALENSPDVVMIADADAALCLDRLKDRFDKKDNAIFEVLSFQRKAEQGFNSKWFRELFEKHGSKVIYLDCNKERGQMVADAIKVFEMRYEQKYQK